MAEEGQILVLGQFGEVSGRKIRLPGLLVEGHPQEPEQDQGQKPGRTPLPPEEGQGGPESDRDRQQPGLRQVQAPGRGGNPRHQGQGYRHQGPGQRPQPQDNARAGAAPGGRGLTFPGWLPMHKETCRTIHGRWLAKINYSILHPIILFDK